MSADVGEPRLCRIRWQIFSTGAAVLGHVAANDQVPQAAAEPIGRVSQHSSVTFLILVNLLLLVVGMFLHAAAAIILIVPILMSMALQYGTNPVHFGAIVCFNLAVGQQMPPTAGVLLTVCGISGVKMVHSVAGHLVSAIGLG